MLQEASITELIVRTCNGTVTETFREESSDPASLSSDSVLNLTKILVPDITATSISLIDNAKVQVCVVARLRLQFEMSH